MRLRRFAHRRRRDARARRCASARSTASTSAVVYDDTIARNRFTGRPTLGFSNITGTLNVPLDARASPRVLDGGVQHGRLGLRHDRACASASRATAAPARGIVSGAFGVAWVSDRTICDFEAVVPCPGGTALSYGPTISAGVERRF